MKFSLINRSLAIALAIACFVSVDAISAENNVASKWKLERDVQVGNHKQDYLVEDVPSGVKPWRLRIKISKEATSLSYDHRCDIRQEGDHTDLDFSMLDGREGSICKLTNIGGLHETKVTSVKLPDTLSEIGWRTFCGCEALTNINLGKVKHIGSMAFVGSGLEGVADLRSLTSIAAHTFKGSKKLTGILINPEQITEIGGQAFDNCTNFTGEIVLPNVTQIEGRTFASTKITSIDAPKVKQLGGWAFTGCSKLRNVNFPELEKIDKNAFSGCSTDVDDAEFNFPKVKTMEAGVFKGSGVTSVLLPAITEFAGGQFADCHYLMHAEINNIKSLPDWSFGRCLSLKSIKLPYSITNISKLAFSHSWTEPIMIHARSPIAYDMLAERVEIEGLYFTRYVMTYGGAVIDGDVEWYYDDCDTKDDSVTNVLTIVASPKLKGAEVMIPGKLSMPFNSNYDKPVKQKVVAIGPCAFKDNVDLKGVKIPATVERIGLEAFPKGCKLCLEEGDEKRLALIEQLKAEYGEANVSTYKVEKSWYQFW